MHPKPLTASAERLTKAGSGSLPLGLRGHYTLATWFGCGFSKIAPGTVGSLGAVPLLWALSHWQSVWLNLAFIVVLSASGAWSAHAVATHRGDDDPGLVVIDEVAGVLIAFTCVLFADYRFQILAWVLFRFFDITKPGPIATLEHTKPIGVGIMLDDLLAGLVAGALAFGASLIWA
jgi:phosphatidylglycerophosphatase A